MDRRPRSVIAPSDWTAPDDIAHALRDICPTFEIIHDPLTHPANVPPEYGCHLYSLDESRGVLRLETSLQHETAQPWPRGQPREAGWWIVDWALAHMKSNLAPDDYQALKRIVADAMEHNEKNLIAVAKADLERGRWWAEDYIVPYAIRDRVSVSANPAIAAGRRQERRIARH